MTTVVQKGYLEQMRPAPPSTDEQRLERIKTEIAKVAGDFFEAGPPKRFFEEWDAEARPNEDRAAHYAALRELAKGVQEARAKYWNACR